MANFAVLSGNEVSNIIVADNLEIAEFVTGLKCVEYSSDEFVQIGYLYVDGVFVAPQPEEVTNG